MKRNTVRNVMKGNKFYKRSRFYFTLSALYFAFLLGVVVLRNPDFTNPYIAALLLPLYVFTAAFAELWQKENKREYNKWFTRGAVLLTVVLLVSFKELIY